MSKTYFESLDSCEASTRHLREQLGTYGNERGKEETPAQSGYSAWDITICGAATKSNPYSKAATSDFGSIPAVPYFQHGFVHLTV
jgi:hypothetical protein